MAIDVCSEISSPRISFSHDLNQARENNGIIKLEKSLSDSNFDFDFCISSSFLHEFSSADELFSNGKILPIQIKKPNPNPTNTQKKKQLKEFLLIDDEEEEEEKSCKPFWQFKRSNSLNCDNSRGRKSFIKSLQFLTRSNSTGSTLSPNPTRRLPEKPQLQKQHSVPNRKKPAPFYPYSYYSGQNRLRKCGSYGGSTGFTITPVLNISRGTVNLFGLGSFFCNSKVKNKKR